MAPWRIRATMDEIHVARRYAGHPTIFSVRLHHGGQFTKFPGRKYIKGKQNYVDLLDIDTFSIHDIDEMMEELGHIDSDETLLYYHFLRPFGDLDFGLFALGSDQDVHHLGTYVANHKVIDVYIEHGKTNLHTYSMSPNPSKVKIVEIKEPPACSKQLFLEWNDSPIEHESVPDLTEVENDSHLDKEPSLVDHIEFEMNVENEDDYDGSGHNNGSGNDEFDDDSESEDSDFFIDEDNLIHDVDVDMKDFHMNIDKDVEWVGGSSESNVPEDTQQGDLEVINTEVLLSGSSSDEANDGKRRKTIRAIHRAYENDAALVSEPFYIFQTFSSSKDFKTQVKLHSIRTRREIQLEKNDKNRVRFVCKGTIPNLATNEEEKCPWVIYCSKWKRDIDWMVKTYTKEHRCLQTRKVKACDYKFLSEHIVQVIETNPKIPIRALREQLQREYQMDISHMKTFRAKQQALKHVQGDYASQYRLLRDYVLEVQARNPDTTVKIDVESEANPTVETRTFRRIYVCIGALKRGFAAGRRDFLGLDGAFVKGPYPGQVLSAVALDGNNGIYPLAYAVVESETLNSWTWFLSNLGDDLGLGTNSNFTFMSDRQKGLLPAIATLFPCAEHRYCLRHIHDNMKKNWRGKVFKDLLWECATTSNVQHFHQAMEKLKKLNNDAYEWLKQIPPQSWARSHFTAFNSKIEDGRDAPIINCIEFIREYIMKKIVKVDKEIQKVVGPLTPTATTILDNIKSKAEQYVATFCGAGKYQVAGPWQDQCIVDVGQQSCTCKRWELTGIPCKHGVAAIWDMGRNDKDVGIPESFVHPCYWLSSWKEMYSFKVSPINGRSMWEKSAIPTTLLPPKHRVPIGRPKKKRTISIVEKEDFVRGNTASRAHRSVTCTKCNNVGHNARTCKGQRPIVGGGGGQSQVKGKGKGKATT
ncbi:unnamed protein product [Lactuca saligna]|uniref:SWIM-type domain-containing protein n=1 Tax=Lactuca saligna TaxID=75948 RepID=A0AA36A3X8_LACSI|nr:unnamed protein product [Lactuca saligna]